MEYILEGHDFYYDLHTVMQIFYPNGEYVRSTTVNDCGVTLQSILDDGFCTTIIYEDGEIAAEHKLPVDADGWKTAVKMSAFNVLKGYTNMETPWGALTGIRPTKLIFEMWEKGFDDKKAVDILNKKFYVSGEKARLCIDIAHTEKSIIKDNSDKKVSLYIGIPFCPTKCLYCSFTSYPIERHKHLVWDYLNALNRELEFLRGYMEGKIIETVYIGGGTPTSLGLDELSYLLESMRFECEKEFTVEAGRPDTVTYDKLRLLKDYGVNRISINPQTMNDRTLEVIGRKHTPEQFLKAFYLAREAGHENINIDLIAGLPGETREDVKNTMERIKDLRPESITVHTLAVKRASRLKETLSNFSLIEPCELEEMLRITKSCAEDLNMHPYYMYRQKNMLGNFENVGYCREGFEGIYNVQIMEEKQTILAVGAGAVTKIVDTCKNRIERIFNVKNVNEYINRIDEMIERKGLFL